MCVCDWPVCGEVHLIHDTYTISGYHHSGCVCVTDLSVVRCTWYMIHIQSVAIITQVVCVWLTCLWWGALDTWYIYNQWLSSLRLCVCDWPVCGEVHLIHDTYTISGYHHSGCVCVTDLSVVRCTWYMIHIQSVAIITQVVYVCDWPVCGEVHLIHDTYTISGYHHSGCVCVCDWPVCGKVHLIHDTYTISGYHHSGCVCVTDLSVEVHLIHDTYTISGYHHSGCVCVCDWPVCGKVHLILDTWYIYNQWLSSLRLCVCDWPVCGEVHLIHDTYTISGYHHSGCVCVWLTCLWWGALDTWYIYNQWLSSLRLCVCDWPVCGEVHLIHDTYTISGYHHSGCVCVCDWPVCGKVHLIHDTYTISGYHHSGCVCVTDLSVVRCTWYMIHIQSVAIITQVVCVWLTCLWWGALDTTSCDNVHRVQQYVSYILVVSFIDGGNRSTRRKPPTWRKSLTNFIT